MSKTINQLNQLDAQRAQKYTSAQHKADSYKESTTPTPQPVSILAKRSHQGNWKVVLPASIVIFILIWTNLVLFLTLKNYAAEKNVTVAKLSEAENILNKNTQQIGALAASVRELGQELNLMNKNIKETNSKAEVQSFAIETLTKAKNTLFNRINSLEIEINKKNSQPPEQ